MQKLSEIDNELKIFSNGKVEADLKKREEELK